jgi:hypothetical protein
LYGFSIMCLSSIPLCLVFGKLPLICHKDTN